VTTSGGSVQSDTATTFVKKSSVGTGALEARKPKETDGTANSIALQPPVIVPYDVTLSMSSSTVLGKKGKVYHYTGNITLSHSSVVTVVGEVHFFGVVDLRFSSVIRVLGEVHFSGVVNICFSSHVDLKEASLASRFHRKVIIAFSSYVVAKENTELFEVNLPGSVQWV
jgi:hypothetical protein